MSPEDRKSDAILQCTSGIGRLVAEVKPLPEVILTIMEHVLPC